jgi:nitrous oxidase accessory protein NosD
MNRKTAIALLFMATLLNLTACTQNSLSFDGSGHQSRIVEVVPGDSISDAIRHAKPGTDILVHAGTYHEAVAFTRSGTEGAPIRLISADGKGAATIVSDKTGIYGFGSKYVGVFGFRVISGAKGQGIHFGMSGSDLTNTSHYVRDVVIADNIIEGAGQDGIKISQADNIRLLHNVIRNSGTDRNANGDGGIDWVAVNRSQAIENLVENSNGHTCFMLKGGSEENLIFGNIMRGCERDGMTVGGMSVGWMRPGTNSEARNNTVVKNDIQAGKYGLVIFGATGNVVKDNVCDGKMGCIAELASSTARLPGGHELWGNHDNRISNNWRTRER